ncbi:MAG: uracil phosphoribosyltransferase [Ignavibacteriaceae bacterium]
MKNNFKNFNLINHPLVKRDISLLRDVSSQAVVFRAALKRIANILAVEVSKDFAIISNEIETPLERTEGFKLNQEIVLVPVLRAGLGMVSGFVDIIPDVKLGHIGIQRNEDTLQPEVYYFKTPKNIKTSKVILIDPMLATGGSGSQALTYLKEKGAKDLCFVCLVASPEGIRKIQASHGEVKIYAAALDRTLNDKGYILPGLGDAGDRTFGTI